MSKVAAGILGFAFLLCVLSTAIPYWITASNRHAGFWLTCVEENSHDTFCFSIDSSKVGDWWTACQAFSILGVLFLFGGAICAFAKKKLLAMGLGGFGAVSAFLTWIIFIANFGDIPSFDAISVSFYFMVLASVIGLAGAGLATKIDTANGFVTQALL